MNRGNRKIMISGCGDLYKRRGERKKNRKREERKKEGRGWKGERRAKKMRDGARALGELFDEYARARAHARAVVGQELALFFSESPHKKLPERAAPIKDITRGKGGPTHASTRAPCLSLCVESLPDLRRETFFLSFIVLAFRF